MHFKTFGEAIEYGRDLMQRDDRIADVHATTLAGKADEWILQLLPKPMDISDLQEQGQIFESKGFHRATTAPPKRGLPPKPKLVKRDSEDVRTVNVGVSAYIPPTDVPW